MAGINALDWAVGQAHVTGAAVRAVAVRQTPVQFAPTPAIPAAEFGWAPRTWIDEMMAELREQFPDSEVDTRVEEGHIPTVLLDHARDAGMLVLGNKGRSPLGGALLGSVVLQCLHHAPCPVLVIP